MWVELFKLGGGGDERTGGKGGATLGTLIFFWGGGGTWVKNMYCNSMLRGGGNSGKETKGKISRSLSGVVHRNKGTLERGSPLQKKKFYHKGGLKTCVGSYDH